MIFIFFHTYIKQYITFLDRYKILLIKYLAYIFLHNNIMSRAQDLGINHSDVTLEELGMFPIL